MIDALAPSSTDDDTTASRRAPSPPLGSQEPWKSSPLVSFSVALHGVALLALALRPRLWKPLAALLAVDHLALCSAGMWPRSRLLGPNTSHFHHHNTATPWVALTLDDGPDPEVTPRVLDLLAQRRARVSFFCIGRHAASRPDIVRRMVDEGHRVENHTLHHRPYFSLLGSRAQEREITGAQEILQQLSGRAPRWFRAPAGIQNPLLGPILHRLGLNLVSWTRRGFDAVERNPRRIVQRLGHDLRSGDILVLHDGFGPRDRRRQAVILQSLPMLLDQLEGRGLQALPLPDPPGSAKGDGSPTAPCIDTAAM